MGLGGLNQTPKGSDGWNIIQSEKHEISVILPPEFACFERAKRAMSGFDDFSFFSFFIFLKICVTGGERPEVAPCSHPRTLPNSEKTENHKNVKMASYFPLYCDFGSFFACFWPFFEHFLRQMSSKFACF